MEHIAKLYSYIQNVLAIGTALNVSGIKKKLMHFGNG